ncbi:MAG: AAA family ATPase, partial [Candidatus Riflebacteria bacterium]|nr:AAA family ATPase [Candidatus Riflebacteria bacterium]
MSSTTYTKRLVERHCRKALSDRKILVLIGTRQTGKSTLARQLISRVPDHERLVLNLDDPFLRDHLVQGEQALVRQMEEK